MKSFIKRQKKQLHELGLLNYIAAIRVELRRRSSVLMAGILFPLYLVILLIRPLKLIRFGSLMADRIGHFAGNNEIYLCEKDHGLQPAGSLDIFYYSMPACNHQLLEMWKRVLRVSRFAVLFRWICVIPGGDKHNIATTNSDRDVYGLLEKSKIHLSFTPDEERRGEAGLRKMGINNGEAYICVVGRDPAYLASNYPYLDWTYHDYRNSSIQNFVLACEELAREFYVIRMGNQIKEIMQTDNPKIIEYAYRGFRTELLDIYLPAHCYLCLSNGTGLDGISRVFRRPHVFVNIVPLEYIITWMSQAITIPKKYWLKKEKRFMTFGEILESGAGRYLHTHKFEDYGIELIENTPEEIRDVAIEMDERLKGTWESTEEDEELQRRFWSLFKSSNLNKVFHSRIGAEFLRQNRELLD